MGRGSKRSGLQDSDKVPRSRAPNFTDSEKDCFLDEVLPKYVQFLEDKRQDGTPWKVKEAKWEEATARFNSLSGRYVRTVKQLKDLWGNLKTAARAAVGDEKVETFATGGGTVDRSKGPTARDLRVLALIKASGRGLRNPYDSDARDAAEGSGEQQNINEAPANAGVLLAQGDGSIEVTAYEVVYEPEDIANMNFGGIVVPPTAQVEALSMHNWSTHCPRNLYTRKPDALCLEPSTAAVPVDVAEPGPSHAPADVTSTPVSVKHKRSVSEEVEWANKCKKRRPSLARQEEDSKKKELTEPNLEMTRTLQKFLKNDQKLVDEEMKKLQREEERKEALFKMEMEKHKLELEKLRRELGEK